MRCRKWRITNLAESCIVEPNLAGPINAEQKLAKSSLSVGTWNDRPEILGLL